MKIFQFGPTFIIFIDFGVRLIKLTLQKSYFLDEIDYNVDIKKVSSIEQELKSYFRYHSNFELSILKELTVEQLLTAKEAGLRKLAKIDLPNSKKRAEFYHRLKDISYLSSL